MNQTELINYAVDIQYDYNMKFIFLLLVTIYSLFVIWYWHRTPVEYLSQYYLKGVTLVLSKVWFAALPLWIFMLYRTVPIDAIFQPLIVLYGIAGVFFFIYMFVYGADKIREFFTGERFWRNRR